jgi:hypothetical protein
MCKKKIFRDQCNNKLQLQDVKWGFAKKKLIFDNSCKNMEEFDNSCNISKKNIYNLCLRGPKVYIKSMFL